MEPSINRLVSNFVEQYRKPFSVDVLCGLIGKTRKQVRPVITRLMFDGKVAEPERGIFVAIRAERVSHCQMNGSMLWHYHAGTGLRILDILNREKIRTVRDLGSVMGVSRQYAYLYLEALASIGCATWDGERYISTGKSDLLSLGCNVQKGILGRLRNAKREGAENG